MKALVLPSTPTTWITHLLAPAKLVVALMSEKAGPKKLRYPGGQETPIWLSDGSGEIGGEGSFERHSSLWKWLSTDPQSPVRGRRDLTVVGCGAGCQEFPKIFTLQEDQSWFEDLAKEGRKPGEVLRHHDIHWRCADSRGVPYRYVLEHADQFARLSLTEAPLVLSLFSQEGGSVLYYDIFPLTDRAYQVFQDDGIWLTPSFKGLRAQCFLLGEFDLSMTRNDGLPNMQDAPWLMGELEKAPSTTCKTHQAGDAYVVPTMEHHFDPMVASRLTVRKGNILFDPLPGEFSADLAPLLSVLQHLPEEDRVSKIPLMEAWALLRWVTLLKKEGLLPINEDLGNKRNLFLETLGLTKLARLFSHDWSPVAVYQWRQGTEENRIRVSRFVQSILDQLNDENPVLSS